MAGGVISEGHGSRMDQYQGRTTFAVILIAIVASAGGLIFGFDMGITGGQAQAAKQLQLLLASFLLVSLPQLKPLLFCISGVTTNPDFAAQFFPETLNATDKGPFCK